MSHSFKNKAPLIFLSLEEKFLLLHTKLTGLSLLRTITEFLFKDDLRHHSVVSHLGISLEQQNRCKIMNDSAVITIA